ncbi:MAG TPA: hypothetical protein VFR67_12905 [Pilimelia sp.]|nr:hypothetical protein [Pilimelia sp.]
MDSGFRNAAAAVAVLAALVALVVVPAVVGQWLPEEGPLPGGPRLDIGYGASLHPPPGARLALVPSRPGAGEVELRVGGLTARFTAVQTGDASLAGFTAHARHKLSRDEGLRAGAPEPASTDAGVRGERGTVDDDGGLTGCYAIFMAEDAGVVALITPVASCEVVPPPVWSAVRSLTFEPAGVG